MFRRKASEPAAQQPVWRERFDRARALVESQSPPPWMLDRLAQLDELLVAAEHDHTRLTAALGQLDLDRATTELKEALRGQGPNPTPESQRLVDALRARYESIHDLVNKQTAIRRGIDGALVDVELLAARSVELGARSDRWQLDDTVARLQIDLDALELARRELADL